MSLSVIILPDNSELEHTLWHLDNFKGLPIFGVGPKEGTQAFDEFVASLLERHHVK
jgi:hypothetical protein